MLVAPFQVRSAMFLPLMVPDSVVTLGNGDAEGDRPVAGESAAEEQRVRHDGEVRCLVVDGVNAVVRRRDPQKPVRFRGQVKESIQILLFDLIMPKMNGKEAYDEIRKIKPDMKIIFTGGYAADIIRQKASLEDGTHLIYKPLSPMALLRKVRSVLDGTAA